METNNIFSASEMGNEQVMTVVIVIALIAVAGRILINRGQKGKIDWKKLALTFIAGLSFIITFLLPDAYRLDKAIAGTAEKEDLNTSSAIGRTAGESVPVVSSFSNGVTPPYFTAEVETIEPTGYWQVRKLGLTDETVDRTELVDEKDETRTAIRRKTNVFTITKSPKAEADYNQIYTLTLKSGEKVLGVLDAADAQPGRLPVSTTEVLNPKMAEIAAQDSTTLQTVYVKSFDSVRYSTQPAAYLLIKATLAAIVAAALTGIAALIFRKI